VVTRVVAFGCDSINIDRAIVLATVTTFLHKKISGVKCKKIFYWLIPPEKFCSFFVKGGDSKAECIAVYGFKGVTTCVTTFKIVFWKSCSYRLLYKGYRVSPPTEFCFLGW
jgi:hypothetical protein